MVSKENLSQTITLKDGRILGYAEVGNQGNQTLFWFHGGGSSRLEIQFIETIVNQHNIHVIAPDRPGIGLSSFQRNRVLLDWPSDVKELADHLGIDKFAIAGVSGGGPHVAACAYSIPERITGCGMISSTGSIDLKEAWKKYPRAFRTTFFLARSMSWVFKPIMRLQLRGMKSMDIFQKMTLRNSNLPEADRKLIVETDFFPKFYECGVEGMKQGTRGIIQEYKIFASSWGFNLQDLSSNIKIFVCAGDQDPNSLFVHPFTDMIPKATAKIFQNEGHLSAVINHGEEIISTVL
ncbi:MAG: alpha/beta hydrolase [Candidatus Heimdallarchaeota archaeon]|nr:MAG: alpha/beta hydrolase [Candidatus Heimdallarchaeota archaeon]